MLSVAIVVAVAFTLVGFLRSPDLADRVQKVGEHLRFNSSLPPRLGVSGYYTLVSMILNVAEIPLPAGVPSPW